MSLLVLEGVRATYDTAVVALEDVSLSVRQGEILALLGANGVGKSTTLRAVSNLLPSRRGAVARGRIVFDGADITHRAPHRIVRSGIAQVVEGRHCFRSLTIEQNLLTGTIARGASRAQTRQDLEAMYALFPRLVEKRSLQAGLASGGEQQMAAIGRALMSRPRLLVLDEPSMGLAPMTVTMIFAALRKLNLETGLTILVAEQNSAAALRTADRAAVLEHGVVALEGDAATLRDSADIRALYLGQSKLPRPQMARVASG